MADPKQATDVDLARRVDLVCDRFEGNWRLGRRQTLESYLVSVESTERDAYLKALLELELELRRQQGEDPQLKEYLARFLADQAIVESLFEGGGKRDSLIASRPTVDSKIDQTNTGQRRQPGQIRQVVPTEFGRYRIKSQIGAGGMGTVVLAEDTLLGRPVALKIPYLSGTDIDEQIKRFDREARTAAMLRHPNICPIYDFGEINGIRYISMAYIEGLPLHKYAAEKPLDERQIARLIGKLAGALQEAHDNGVVHRDLKPANIMVDKKDEPIVMDFGLAMQMQWEADVRLTQTGMQMGSPAYMPPEQVDGDKTRIGPAADIYSLGVVLYELLTGRIPFEGPTASIFVQIIMKEPIRPSMLRAGLSPDFEAICLKMMAKRIEDRYASMVDVADAMREFIKQHVVGNPAKNSPVSATAEGDKTVLMEPPATADVPSKQPISVGDIVIVDEEAELRLLMLDISNALRDHQIDGLLEMVERFLELQPDNPAILRLREKLPTQQRFHHMTALRAVFQNVIGPTRVHPVKTTRAEVSPIARQSSQPRPSFGAHAKAPNTDHDAIHAREIISHWVRASLRQCRRWINPATWNAEPATAGALLGAVYITVVWCGIVGAFSLTSNVTFTDIARIWWRHAFLISVTMCATAGLAAVVGGITGRATADATDAEGIFVLFCRDLTVFALPCYVATFFLLTRWLPGSVALVVLIPTIVVGAIAGTVRLRLSECSPDSKASWVLFRLCEVAIAAIPFIGTFIAFAIFLEAIGVR